MIDSNDLFANTAGLYFDEATTLLATPVDREGPCALALHARRGAMDEARDPCFGGVPVVAILEADPKRVALALPVEL